MNRHLKKLLHIDPIKLNLLIILMIIWTGYFAWKVAWPFTWLSIPILLCYGYIILRLAYEQIFNKGHAPTMATGYAARHKISEILAKDAARNPKTPYNILDLGSGRGELTRRLALDIPNAVVVGIEKEYFPFHESTWVQRLLGPQNLFYKRSDFWDYDCSGCDAVILYLMPAISERLGEKLAKELKHGALIISHDFPLHGKWEPIEIYKLHAPFKDTLYVYRKELPLNQ
ncbi:MAG: hypothetical protein RBT70_02130 [Alphaproteobacteria bacterium]|jgi:SAM-dependent methyltransferase|nr:hypothetical protein [Alphaproteobacteria bacterium]